MLAASIAREAYECAAHGAYLGLNSKYRMDNMEKDGANATKLNGDGEACDERNMYQLITVGHSRLGQLSAFDVGFRADCEGLVFPRRDLPRPTRTRFTRAAASWTTLNKMTTMRLMAKTCVATTPQSLSLSSLHVGDCRPAINAGNHAVGEYIGYVPRKRISSQDLFGAYFK